MPKAEMITTTLATGRRRLAAGLLATVAGAGLTSGIAAGVATVADAMPVQPDAELIALCERFCAIERRHYAEFSPLSCAGNDDQADAVMERMAAEHGPLLDRIMELPPRTFEGATALATALDTWSHGDFAPHDSTDELLARTLIRGLMGRTTA